MSYTHLKKENQLIDIGIYPLNYTWDKNIFNQLCIGKMLDNSNINYNELDKRMTEFLTTMKIESKPEKIENINEYEIINKVIKNDINVSCAFTEYLHPVFFISMEQGLSLIHISCVKREEKTKKDKLFNNGVNLAPLLYFFGYSIVEYAIKNNIEKVYYATREGETFIKIHELIKQDNPFGVELPDCDIIEVSRMGTRCV